MGKVISMFEWLEEEISQIKTPRFHMVDGPTKGKLQEAVIQSSLLVPVSYMEFVLKFGNAKLYHRVESDSYKVGVFAGPREAKLNDGTRILHLGFHDGASAYVKPASNSVEIPIYEFESGPEKRMSSSFEDWLTASCAQARESYGKKEWAEIVRGPIPFTPMEEEIIEARRRIRWRVVGIDPNRNHIFEVTNMGSRALPFLTVGVRSKNGRLNGTVRLKIGHVGPGQTAVLHVGCYKGLVPPDEIEVFALPDPRPEDRARYAELGKTS
jgi:hypothetical protein